MSVTFAERVRLLRIRAGISQVDLARSARVHRRTIVNIEAGSRPSLDVADRVATALGVTLAELVDDDRRIETRRIETRIDVPAGETR